MLSTILSILLVIQLMPISTYAQDQEWEVNESSPSAVYSDESDTNQAEDVTLSEVEDNEDNPSVEDGDSVEDVVLDDEYNCDDAVIAEVQSVGVEETSEVESEEESENKPLTRNSSGVSLTTQAANTTTTATNFWLKGIAPNGYYRATHVYFVDSDGKALSSTVSGTIPYNINEEIDFKAMYADKLAPGTAEEYAFSRVYLKLWNEQKNFQRMQLENFKNVTGGSTTEYRIYCYMDEITECASGGVYNGTWYTISSNNQDTNNVYIVFDHVAEVSFMSVVGDEAQTPVPGATYTLYTDANCYTEFEYDGQVITATSGEDGLTSFGRLPYGTYYMKETTVPTGYKDKGIVRQIDVNANPSIEPVVHEEDDGSVIIADAKSITVHKVWPTGSGHDNDTVDITIHTQGEEPITQTLSHSTNAEQDWTYTFKDLDHTKSYVVTETKVMEGDNDTTDQWIPHISYGAEKTSTRYYKSDSFYKGKQYVLVTQYGALSESDGGLGLTAVDVEDDEVANPQSVTSGMLWTVSSVSRDGVITLRNNVSETGAYLDYVGSSWQLSSQNPQFVRHTNNNGTVNLYYRQNMNLSQATYLVVSASGVSKSSNATDAASFAMYQKTDISEMSVTVTNNAQQRIKMRNMSYYPTVTPIAGSSNEGPTFDLYSSSQYQALKEDASATPKYSSLTVDEEGFLTTGASVGDSTAFQLTADTYYLVQTSQQTGYVPLVKPVSFTVTRGGAILVKRSDQQITDYAYESSVTEKEDGVDITYPCLQIPNQEYASVTVEVSLDDEVRELPEEFDYEVTLLNTANAPVVGWELFDGAVTNASGKVTFSLAWNADTQQYASVQLNVPVGARLLVTQKTGGYSVDVAADDQEETVRSTTFEQQITSDSATVEFANTRAICKIDHDGAEEPFGSLNDAITYAQNNMSGTATIQMLLDYPMREDDLVTIATGCNITLTTAAKQGVNEGEEWCYLDDGDVATITRGAEAGSLFTCAGGSLTLTDIVLDGNLDTYASTGADGGLVKVEEGTFVISEGATLQNSQASCGGGAYVKRNATMVLGSTDTTRPASVIGNAATTAGAGVYLEAGGKVCLSGSVHVSDNLGEAGSVGNLYLAAGAAGSDVELTGNLSDDANISVLAEDAERDGAEMTGDEWFAIAHTGNASDIKGLDRFVSERGGESVRGGAGVTNHVVWPTTANLKVTLRVEGAYANRSQNFLFAVTMPDGVTELQGSVNGTARTFTARSSTFQLKHGQYVEFYDVRTIYDITLTQRSSSVLMTTQEVSTSEEQKYITTATETPVSPTESHVDVNQDASNARVVTMSNIWGATSDPALVTITNSLPDDEVLPMGVWDNLPIWAGITVLSSLSLAVLWLLRRRTG